MSFNAANSNSRWKPEITVRKAELACRGFADKPAVPGSKLKAQDKLRSSSLQASRVLGRGDVSELGFLSWVILLSFEL
jgi:hypothetical protein